MTTRALLVCDGAPIPAVRDDPTLIRERIDWRSPSANLNFSAQNLEDTVLGVVDGRAADLVQIATCAFAADQAISRWGPADVYGRKWHRELHLAVPVRQPDLWSEPAVGRLLVDALSFATDDSWQFTFSALPDRSHKVPLVPGSRDVLGRPEYVVLFSGGADSLCATVELLASDQGRPLLVSHRPTPPVVKRQTDLAGLLRRRFPRYAPSHVSFWIHRRGSDARDTSQRSRGFLFASLGAAAAAQAGLTRVVFADNGVVSLNLPINRGVVGTMASRSTHPGFLARFNRLLGRVFDSPVRVENSLALRTRAEVLEILKANGCDDWLQETSSCSHTRGLPGVQPQCGYCSQCIDRRFGALAAGLEEHDLAERYSVDAFVEPLPEGEARTVAVSYVRLANRLEQMSPEQMFLEIPELMDAVDPTSPQIDGESRAIGAMLQRHGRAVGDVLTELLGQFREHLAHGRLPETCLLRLALGSATVAPPVADQTPGRSAEHIFRRKGKMWRLQFGGHESFVPHEAGMPYLAHLLLNPGQEIDVMALASVTSAGRPSKHVAREDAAALRPDGGTSDSILDEDARQSYVARLRQLAADRTIAKQSGNDVDLALIDDEVRAIEAELARSTGLGGRPRAFSNERERARHRVSRAIDRARETISQAHAPLGRHLDAFVRTGGSCWYKPEPPTRWNP